MSLCVVLQFHGQACRCPTWQQADQKKKPTAKVNTESLTTTTNTTHTQCSVFFPHLRWLFFWLSVCVRGGVCFSGILELQLKQELEMGMCTTCDDRTRPTSRTGHRCAARSSACARSARKSCHRDHVRRAAVDRTVRCVCWSVRMCTAYGSCWSRPVLAANKQTGSHSEMLA